MTAEAALAVQYRKRTLGCLHPTCRLEWSRMVRKPSVVDLRRFFLLVLACCLAGCARFPEDGGTTAPDNQLVVTFTMAGPVRGDYYYFFPIDPSEDATQGPLPVVQGPYWGNGWGTGPFTQFVQYHLNQYSVNRPVAVITVSDSGGFLLSTSGSPTNAQSGTHAITVGPVSLGTATVSGSGTIATVSNLSDQNAGTLTIATDLTGRTVAGSVAFTPALNGGRSLTPAEQAVIDALNAGGVTLAEDSLSVLGLGLTLNSPPLPGSQTIAVPPTTAQASATFTPFGPFPPATTTGLLVANGYNDPTTSAVPGLRIRCSALNLGAQATLHAETDPTPIFLYLPFESVIPPAGTNTIHFTLDLDLVQPNLGQAQVNFITTNEIIIDPNNVGAKVYDALGPRGNDYLSLLVDIPTTYTNDQAPVPELADDCTDPSLDIVDWRIEVLRR